MSRTTVIKAFKIHSAVGWMPQDMGEPQSAACVLMCKGGHRLSVNDAWASVYEPKEGGWLLVNQSGRAAYRSNEEFLAAAEHIQDDYYRVTLAGDILEGVDK
mgnify:CR=1 FL=1